jgi:hypothetical protein
MNAASPAQRTIAKGRALYRKSAQQRALTGFENIDWQRVFSAANRGQALGVVISPRACYRIGMGAIAMHFAAKSPAALVLTISCLPGVGCVVRERSLRKIYA